MTRFLFVLLFLLDTKITKSIKKKRSKAMTIQFFKGTPLWSSGVTHEKIIPQESPLISMSNTWLLI